MEDDIAVLSEYFPGKVLDPRLGNLLSHHLNHLTTCVRNGLYSSSLFHLHILYMIFVYLQIHRIAQYDKKAYNFSLIGFSREEKDLLRDPSYPLNLSVINEKTVFRFFRLNEIEDGVIGILSKPVKARNKHFHASEFIECETEDQFEEIFQEYTNNMDTLIRKNVNIFERMYDDPSVRLLRTRGYIITSDDIESSVILPNYFSKNELLLLTKNKRDKLSQAIKNEFL